MKLIAAALLVTTPQIADAAARSRDKACVTREQVASLGLFVLPSVLPIVVERCRSALPANAWLTLEGPAYAERLAAGREANWPGARAAFEKFSGEATPDGISDTTLRSLVDDAVRAKLPAEIKRAHCPQIDEAARLLAPLPPENLAGIAAMLLEFGSKEDDEFGVCPTDRQ
jgi:hypothetical protein